MSANHAMIIKRFLDWARTATATERAEAAAALVKVYLHPTLDEADRKLAESALIWLVDDASPLVRRALAEAVSWEAGAPQQVILALASDQSDIAALVLARSPILTEADLVDCAAIGDLVTRTAIALRSRLPQTVAAALAEVAEKDAVIALLRNWSARLTPGAMLRIVERLGSDPDVREALLARPNIPVEVRQALVKAVSDALAAFVVACNWLRPERSRRLVDDARESATLALDGLDEESEFIVAHLRQSGQLTAGFLLRALLSLKLPLVEAAFAELSAQPTEQVQAVIASGRIPAFRKLYRSAGMPASLEAAFLTAFKAFHELGQSMSEAPQATVSRRMIERVLTEIGGQASVENEKLFAMLRRFEAEAARAEARGLVQDLLPPLRPISELLADSDSQAAA